jgi:hypothetical protein
MTEPMGHLTFEEDYNGKMIAKIGNKTLYVCDKPVPDGFDSYRCKGDAVVQQIPDKNTERSILYITAPSGSGKSFYTREYISQYKKMYPKREVYVFSSLDDDPTLDKLKYLKRIKIKNPEFMNTEINCSDFKDTLVVFDDCDVISDKSIKAKVFKILNQINQIGRHSNVSCIFTSHTATNGADTKIILSEAHSVTIFVKNSGGKVLRYLLDQYLGLSKEEIMKLKKLDSRWITVVKSYPMIVLSEKEVFKLHDY